MMLRRQVIKQPRKPMPQALIRGIQLFIAGSCGLLAAVIDSATLLM